MDCFRRAQCWWCQSFTCGCDICDRGRQSRDYF